MSDTPDRAVNLCPCSYPHPPHDYCDGTPVQTRTAPPVPPPFPQWLNQYLADPDDEA